MLQKISWGKKFPKLICTESPVLNTTFPNLTGLPVFMDSKDDIELKRNSQISEAIQIFTGFIASEKVSL